MTQPYHVILASAVQHQIELAEQYERMALTAHCELAIEFLAKAAALRAWAKDNTERARAA